MPNTKLKPHNVQCSLMISEMLDHQLSDYHYLIIWPVLEHQLSDCLIGWHCLILSNIVRQDYQTSSTPVLARQSDNQCSSSSEVIRDHWIFDTFPDVFIVLLDSTVMVVNIVCSASTHMYPSIHNGLTLLMLISTWWLNEYVHLVCLHTSTVLLGKVLKEITQNLSCKNYETQPCQTWDIFKSLKSIWSDPYSKCHDPKYMQTPNTCRPLTLLD